MMRVSSCTRVKRSNSSGSKPFARLVLGLRHARLHLGLGLQFDLAQLIAQAVQIAGQVLQRGRASAPPGRSSASG
jgi:hypothetical protein